MTDHNLEVVSDKNLFDFIPPKSPTSKDARRIEILNGLIRDFGEPQTEVERSLLHTLSRVMLALEKLDPVEHAQVVKSLVASHTELTCELQKIRDARVEARAAASNQRQEELEKLTDEELLEQIIALSRQQLDIREAQLKEIREKRMLSNHPSPENTGIVEQIAPVSTGATTVQIDSVTDHVTTTDEKLVVDPIEQCPYCYKSLADCHDMRASRVETWEVLHHDSPEMVAKRRDYNTREMFESMRRQGR